MKQSLCQLTLDRALFAATARQQWGTSHVVLPQHGKTPTAWVGGQGTAPPSCLHAARQLCATPPPPRLLPLFLNLLVPQLKTAHVVVLVVLQVGVVLPRLAGAAAAAGDAAPAAAVVLVAVTAAATATV